MMTAPKLGFLKLIVRDLEAQRRFYETALGFRESQQFEGPFFRESLIEQEPGGMAIILVAYTDGRDIPDPRLHGPTGFVTQAIERTHADLVAAGAAPKGEIMEVIDGIKVAFLEDPEGHEIEICQFPATGA